MKEWFKKVFVALIEARQRQANARIAEMQLYRMTDRELNDIGIGRGDIKRVVYEEDNKKEKEYSKFSGKLYKANHA